MTKKQKQSWISRFITKKVTDKAKQKAAEKAKQAANEHIRPAAAQAFQEQGGRGVNNLQNRLEQRGGNYAQMSGTVGIVGNAFVNAGGDSIQGRPNNNQQGYRQQQYPQQQYGRPQGRQQQQQPQYPRQQQQQPQPQQQRQLASRIIDVSADYDEPPKPGPWERFGAARQENPNRGTASSYASRPPTEPYQARKEDIMDWYTSGRKPATARY